MTQPIKLTVNINPASAVRAGRAQCGALEVLLTEASLASLSELEREYLALHLEKKREHHFGAGTFDHGASLGTPELAQWGDDTLRTLLLLRITEHTKHVNQSKKYVADEICRIGTEMVRPPLKRISRAGRIIDGYEEVGASSELRALLPAGMAEMLDAENAERRAYNEKQVALSDAASAEEQRKVDEKRQAFCDQVMQHIDDELITRRADGLDRKGEWQTAWETAVLKVLGVEGYRVEYDADALTEATPEQYAALRHEREIQATNVKHTDDIDIGFKPAVLNGQFAIELILKGNIGLKGAHDHIKAVKVFPEILVDNDTDDDDDDV